jgi:hypothetical protein
MITFFCQFSAKNIGVFLNVVNAIIIFLQKLAVVRAKNAKFLPPIFFGENIFKIITSVPSTKIAPKKATKSLKWQRLSHRFLRRRQDGVGLLVERHERRLELARRLARAHRRSLVRREVLQNKQGADLIKFTDM